MSRRNNNNNHENEEILRAILEQLLQDEDVLRYAIEQYFDYREAAGTDCDEYVWTVACTF